MNGKRMVEEYTRRPIDELSKYAGHLDDDKDGSWIIGLCGRLATTAALR
jgi:hypothetical protein